MAILVANPLALDLSARFLAKSGLAPWVAGDDWALRFSARDRDGNPLSLTGALLLMTVRESELPTAAALVTRRSDTNITATSIKQMEADPDQSVEDTINRTGKGWFVVRSSDEEETVIRAAAGNRPYDIRVKYASGIVITHYMGYVEILDPRTRPTT